MKYANEEKDQIVRKYFELQASDVPVSIRTYAAHVGVKYYTFRDWYRDYKAGVVYRDISTDEYSNKRKIKDGSSIDNGFSFVRITKGGLQ